MQTRVSYIICFILIFLCQFELIAQKKKKNKTAVSDKEENAYIYRIDKRELEKQGYYIEAVQQNLLGNVEDAIGLFETVIRLDNKNHAAHYELCRIYYENEELEKAIEHGKIAVQLHTTNEWYYLYLAEAQAETGDFEAAAKTYEKMISSIEDAYDYHFDWAYMLTKANKIEEAIAVYDRLEDKYGINETIIAQKESLYIKLGKVDKAAAEIQKLIDEYPQDLRYYGMLGELYEANNELKKAIEAYNMLLKIDPENAQGQLALADILKKDGQEEEAKALINKVFKNSSLGIDTKIMLFIPYIKSVILDSTNKEEVLKMADLIIEQHPNDPKSHTAKGDILWNSGEKKASIESYKKAVSIGESPQTVWYQLFQGLAELKEYEELKNFADKSIEENEESVLPYFYKGIACQQLKQSNEAIESYQKALNLAATDMQIKNQVLSNMADIYNDLELFEKSDSCFEEALLLDPNNAYVLNNYSYYLSLRDAKLEKAQKMSKKANLLIENNAAFQDTYAWVLYKSGDYEGAKDWMEKALSNIENDQRPVLLEHYGDILFKLGKVEEAVANWQKALDAGGEEEILKNKITNRTLEKKNITEVEN